jgi:DNA-binding Lrp family transcriptional regulator
MSFVDAIRSLNGLKRRGVIRDYVIIGAVAATTYMEPIFTEDLDVVVLVDTDDEYRRAFRRVAEHAEGQEGMHYVISGIPVQMFPSTTKPLYLDTLEKARLARMGSLRVKVAAPEHLVLLYLESFRDKDRVRIARLLDVVDRDLLCTLLERFDDEQRTLARRLQTLF